MSFAELPGDFFDRQRCIDGWDQARIESQSCFVLGVGGIGCTIAIALCRLGVKEIYLLDRDVVEASNLNRQILFSPKDVGRKKVDAAVDGLAPHALATRLLPVHMDAVLQWDQVVSIAKKCTVLFNAIDVGGVFDYAVLSLCRHLRIPCASGSSYARTCIYESATSDPEYSSFSLDPGPVGAAMVAKLHPDLITSYASLSFVPSDPTPPTRTIGSSCLVAMLASVHTVNAWTQALMGATMPNWVKLDIVDGDVLAFPPPNAADHGL